MTKKDNLCCVCKKEHGVFGISGINVKTNKRETYRFCIDCLVIRLEEIQKKKRKEQDND